MKATIRRVFDRFVIVVALLLCTTTAYADDAATLKKRGDEAFDARRFEEAMRAYEQAYSASQDPALLYNIGRSYEAIGRYPEALEHLTMFSTLAPAEVRKKTPKLEALIDDLQRRVATARVKSNVGGARIIVRDVVVGRTVEGTTTIKLNAGEARMEVIKDGYASWTKTVDFRGGTTVSVDVVLSAKPTVIEPPKPDTTVSGTTPPPRNEPPNGGPPITSKWWFWTGGAVVVVTGVIVILAVTIEKDQPNGSFGNGTTTAPLITF